MTEDDDRHFLHGEFLGGEQTCVPCDDVIISADQNWVCPAELLNRGSDVGHLFPAVRPRVVDPRNQSRDRPTLDADVGVHGNRNPLFGRQAPIIGIDTGRCKVM